MIEPRRSRISKHDRRGATSSKHDLQVWSERAAGSWSEGGSAPGGRVPRRGLISSSRPPRAVPWGAIERVSTPRTRRCQAPVHCAGGRGGSPSCDSAGARRGQADAGARGDRCLATACASERGRGPPPHRACSGSRSVCAGRHWRGSTSAQEQTRGWQSRWQSRFTWEGRGGVWGG